MGRIDGVKSLSGMYILRLTPESDWIKAYTERCEILYKTPYSGPKLKSECREKCDLHRQRRLEISACILTLLTFIWVKSVSMSLKKVQAFKFSF